MGICDDESVIGVFLDEKKADEYVKEHNKDREEEMKLYERCNKCIEGTNKKTFNLKDSCENAIIKEDRYGLYCENDMSDYYRGANSNSYWKVEKDILGQ